MHLHSARAPAAGKDVDRLGIDTIRTLAIDAVQKAQSGHAGAPMGLAPVAYTLWQEFLRYDPADPLWANRDRFVLSNGHASMLLYALLHLAGVRRSDGRRVTDAPAVSLDDIKNFRQLDSVTPGHPEYGRTTGVEATTGPLGQGCGNSVGMAIASRWLGARYNRPHFPLFDFDVYTICSDGDLMEGVASEAASLAGHLGLANLCWIYDNNTVTIEGHTDLAFTEDVESRFRGYRWNVARLRDANDTAALARALGAFRRADDRPTIIVVDSIIGYGAPHKQNTAAAHSDPLGEDEARLTKLFYGWPQDAQFLVPNGVYDRFRDGIGRRGRTLRDDWMKTFVVYRNEHPQAAREIDMLLAGQLPGDWNADLPQFPADATGMATRDASGKVLNSIAKNIPWLIGGAGDLSPSTKTTLDNASSLEPGQPDGRIMHFGVREHAMGAVVNGLVLSKLRAFGATFLTFSDYMRPSLRLAAMMELPVFHVFTHEFDRSRRGRSDASADRAAGGAARHSEHDRAAPGRRQRSPRGLQGHFRLDPGARLSRAQPAKTPDIRPRPLRPRGRSRTRRLRAGRCRTRRPAGDPHRQRQRGANLHRRLRRTQTPGHCRPRRQHAELGAVRAAGCALSQRGAAAQYHRARDGRARRRGRLGPLRRTARDDHRHAQLRRFGSGQRFAAEIRFRSG